MHTVVLPIVGTGTAWRDAARGLLGAGVPPGDVLWHHGEAGADLFSGPAPEPPTVPAARVPASFVILADTVVWHCDPQRFALLYALLWRLPNTPGLMSDRADAALSRLRGMEKNVRRCAHKMEAFVRFREVGEQGAPRRSFAAWFEPTHLTLEPTAPFFARRFGDMDWAIATPDLTARCVGGVLSFQAGAARPDLPEDATEGLWTTYFRNIFNPARVKISAMTSEMPRKYWKNMPETRAIPDLLAQAEGRVRAMQDAGPGIAPARAARITDELGKRLRAPALHTVMGEPATKAAIDACIRCPLHADATQGVPGEGPRRAPLMIVGEQPGDAEDIAGHPFVGPAGRLFDEIARAAGLDRRAAYVTNAVKHFKFLARGKRRIHQNPNTSEIAHCRFWLAAEIAQAQPKLILALGGTAAESLTGTRKAILARRGTIEAGRDGIPVFLTVHPSYLLRLPEEELRTTERLRFRDDLIMVRNELARLVA